MSSDPGLDPPGSGTNLPYRVLLSATLCAVGATVLSLWTIWLQLKNYRKPTLQRFVVRILVMVPIYSVASLISLYSLDLAFFMDAIRDVYEAFVIYCFFTLLVEYLGGERSLIILLHGRRPIPHPWPVSIFFPSMDVSDPFTFLGLKRGILQYVQIKPILAALTILLKALGTYKDGSLERDSGYTYIAICYNVSVSLCLYCLAMFWVATHGDLQPYRPMPKFLCVKGIIFFTFWQDIGVSILVAAGALKSDRYPTELLSLAIQDTLICFEMPLFAFMHLFAFSHTDYIDENHQYSGRLPFFYALRDAFGYKDVFSDSITTVKGTGFSYRTFEPAEGGLHQGLGRDRRVRAGLRYADGGKTKYWLPMPGEEADAHGRKGTEGVLARPLHTARRFMEERLDAREGYAPLRDGEAADVVHDDPRQTRGPDGYEAWLEDGGNGAIYDGESDTESLGFGAPETDDEDLYTDARRLEFGDFNYPIVDASKEAARRRMREEEDGVVHRKPLRKRKGKNVASRPSIARKQFSYGQYADPRHSPPPASTPATAADHPEPEGSRIIDGARRVLHTLTGNDEESEEDTARKRKGEEENRLPSDAVDLVVEDKQAEEEEAARDRRRGEPGGVKKRVYRQTYQPAGSRPASPGSPAPDTPELASSSALTLESTAPSQVLQVKDVIVEDGKEVIRVMAREEEPVATHVQPPSPLMVGANALENPWEQ